MSTHNMFSLRNKKNIDTFWLKKALIKSYVYVFPIQPNYQTVHFFYFKKLLEKLVLKHPPNKGTL